MLDSTTVTWRVFLDGRKAADVQALSVLAPGDRLWLCPQQGTLFSGTCEAHASTALVRVKVERTGPYRGHLTAWLSSLPVFSNSDQEREYLRRLAEHPELKGQRVRVVRTVAYEGEWTRLCEQLARSLPVGGFPAMKDDKKPAVRIDIHEGPLQVSGG